MAGQHIDGDKLRVCHSQRVRFLHVGRCDHASAPNQALQGESGELHPDGAGKKQTCNANE